MLVGASSPQSGRLAAITGVALLLVAALGVVVQLKDAMNTIWNVEEPKETGVWWYLRTYLISFAGFLGLGFLLAVSLVVSAGLAVLSSRTGSAAAIGEAFNFVASMAILTALPCCSNGFPTPRSPGVMFFLAPWSPHCCSTSASSPSVGTSAPKDSSRPTALQRRS
jgi:hypothetical protein